MSKKQQVQKNLELSQKLADFISDNPQIEVTMPAEASYVFFSATDKELNKVNLKLAKSLVKEGKKVVKATETKNQANPWQFTPLAV